MENVFDSVGELSRRLHNREISAVELARGYLERIEAKKNLNAFLDVRPEETLKQAEAADARLSAGTAGPLTGIPIAHKDIFVTKEWSSTAASRMLKGYMSPFDATVVRQLKNAGMVCLGKLNCDEFAMGSGNENSAFGRVHNPWEFYVISFIIPSFPGIDVFLVFIPYIFEYCGLLYFLIKVFFEIFVVFPLKILHQSSAPPSACFFAA